MAPTRWNATRYVLVAALAGLGLTRGPDVSASSRPAAPRATATTITIINADAGGEGFNDPTPVAPVGGNPGTTVGDQRLYVFQYAANLWASLLPSAVEIRVRAKFDPLLCTSTSGVLGSAGPATLSRDFVGAPLPAHWYHVALANRLRGIDLQPSIDDINITFNSNVGSPTCLTVGWYYGVDGNEGTKLELLPVVLHEMGHGLGFSTSTNGSTGDYNSGYPSAFDHFLHDAATGLHWDQMTSPQRAASAVACQGLAWDGPGVVHNAPARLTDRPVLRVNGPAAIAGDYPVGLAVFGPPLTTTPITAKLVLVDDGFPSVTNGCEPLVNGAAVNGNIALIDRGGGCGFVTKVLYAQNAGALAVVIADSAAGCPPGGMGGNGSGVTIPAVRVTQADGMLLKSNLVGLNVTLVRDPNLDSGADAAHRVLMYTPSPFASGSSVSHWDISAQPDLLMEPALTPGVSADVDLTLSAFSDLGWVDYQTPTMVLLFDATPRDDGIELRWQLSDAVMSVVAERSPSSLGPWVEVGGTPQDEGGVMSIVDRDVEPGRAYHFRLVEVETSGQRTTLAELVQAAPGGAASFTLTQVAPNPAQGLVRVEYSLPRAADVRLSVVDVLGREVAVLAHGPMPAGRSQATWNGLTRSGPAPAGVYLVRCQSMGTTLTRSVALAR